MGNIRRPSSVREVKRFAVRRFIGSSAGIALTGISSALLFSSCCPPDSLAAEPGRLTQARELLRQLDAVGVRDPLVAAVEVDPGGAIEVLTALEELRRTPAELSLDGIVRALVSLVQSEDVAKRNDGRPT